MTTEREQLELAAKACGLKHKSTDELSQWLLVEGVRTPLQGAHRWYWNPLADDGDCARVEAALGIELTWFFDRVDALACDVAPVVEYFKDHAGDKNAARRAASVAVAAEIGRLM